MANKSVVAWNPTTKQFEVIQVGDNVNLTPNGGNAHIDPGKSLHLDGGGTSCRISEGTPGTMYVWLNNALAWVLHPSYIDTGNNAFLTILKRGATATVPVFCNRASDTTTGIGGAANTVSQIVGGVEVTRADNSAVAGDTRFMLYDVTKGTLSRVSVGAVDSGGVGFKVLRVPN